jgi:hypothetical protein
MGITFGYRTLRPYTIVHEAASGGGPAPDLGVWADGVWATGVWATGLWDTGA